uniref:Right handed beta helix domain-containing protein n=1 Tax=Ditylum brightwellii TaxID=49249 RepID=A0A7S4SSV2_9STRA
MSESRRKLRQLQEITSSFTSTCDWENGSMAYVNSGTGSDRSDYGSTTSQPYKSIKYAVSQREPCQTIYIMEGLYKNTYFGQSYNHQNTISSMNGVSDLIITNYENDQPVIMFDGPGAFVGGSTSSPTTNVAISGFEIIGPNYDIAYEDAAANRLTDRSYYKGRGVAIWAGHHIHISDLIVHGCPGSGIRVNKGDYVTITNCHVYDNTWWSPRAESAIVLAVSEPADEQTGTKMYLTNNIVHDNVNKIPYYNPNYAWDYSPIGGLDCASYPDCETGLVSGCPWQCRYGKASQDYIIDGSGVYVTRNSDTYTNGWMELTGNTCYKNGINGLVVHRTHRCTVRQNTIYDNGVIPRLDRPEDVIEDWHVGASGKSRQPYSGLTLNNAEDVKLWSNVVAARYGTS